MCCAKNGCGLAEVAPASAPPLARGAGAAARHTPFLKRAANTVHSHSRCHITIHPLRTLLSPKRYPAVYLFKYVNMRNDKFKELRDGCRDTCR